MCSCSRCIGYYREMYQYQYLRQGPADTQKAIYNNREGLYCAGCTGADGTISPTPDPGHDPHPGGMDPGGKPVYNWPSEGAIIDCCRRKLQSGELLVGWLPPGFTVPAWPLPNPLPVLPPQLPPGTAPSPPFDLKVWVYYRWWKKDGPL